VSTAVEHEAEEELEELDFDAGFCIGVALLKVSLDDEALGDATRVLCSAGVSGFVPKAL